MDISRDYRKDTNDLVKKIEFFIDRRCKTHSFSGHYTEETGFYMTPIPNVGVFLVKFPNLPYVAVAGIELDTGDYVFESKEYGKYALNIYELKEMRIQSLVKMAEDEWSIESGRVKDELDQKSVD